MLRAHARNAMVLAILLALDLPSGGCNNPIDETGEHAQPLCIGDCQGPPAWPGAPPPGMSDEAAESLSSSCGGLALSLPSIGSDCGFPAVPDPVPPCDAAQGGVCVDTLVFTTGWLQSHGADKQPVNKVERFERRGIPGAWLELPTLIPGFNGSCRWCWVYGCGTHGEDYCFDGQDPYPSIEPGLIVGKDLDGAPQSLTAWPGINHPGTHLDSQDGTWEYPTTQTQAEYLVERGPYWCNCDQTGVPDGAEPLTQGSSGPRVGRSPAATVGDPISVETGALEESYTCLEVPGLAGAGTIGWHSDQWSKARTLAPLPRGWNLPYSRRARYVLPNPGSCVGTTCTGGSPAEVQIIGEAGVAYRFVEDIGNDTAGEDVRVFAQEGIGPAVGHVTLHENEANEVVYFRLHFRSGDVDTFVANRVLRDQDELFWPGQLDSVLGWLIQTDDRLSANDPRVPPRLTIRHAGGDATNTDPALGCSAEAQNCMVEQIRNPRTGTGIDRVYAATQVAIEVPPTYARDGEELTEVTAAQTVIHEPLRLVQIRDAAGNRPAGSDEPALRSCSIRYDDRGNLRGISDLADNWVIYGSDELGRLTRRCDENQGLTPDSPEQAVTAADCSVTEYDGAWRVARQRNPGKTELELDWFNSNTLLEITATHPDAVDDSGQPRTTKLRYAHDYYRPWRVTGVYNPNTYHRTRYEYDDVIGKVNRIIDPLGRITELEWDTAFSTTDEQGNTVEHTPTADLLTVTQRCPAGLPGCECPPDEQGCKDLATRMAYDDYGQLVSAVGPDGVRIERRYAATTGLLEQERVISSDGSGEQIWAFHYDDPNLPPGTTYGFVTGVRLPDVTVGSAGGAAQTQGTLNEIVYDADNHYALASVTKDSGGLAVTTRFEHDWRGHLTAITDPRGITTTFSNDAFGQKLTETTPAPDGLGSVTSEYRYDPVGNLVAIVTDRGGALEQTVELGYAPVGIDGDYLMTRIEDALARTTRFEYDPLSNGILLRTIEDALAAEPEMQGEARITRYEYTPELWLENVFAHDGRRLMRIQYNAAGQPVYSWDGRGALSRIDYDGLARPFRRFIGHAGVDNHPSVDDTLITEFDSAGRPTRLKGLVEQDGQPGPEEVVLESYTYDGFARPRSTTTSTGARIEWTYDERNRPVLVTRGPAGSTSGRKTRYRYDALDRLTAIVDGADVLDLVTSFDYAPTTANPTDSLTLKKTTDARGQETRRTYNVAGLLESVQNAQLDTWHLRYDRLGRSTLVEGPTGVQTLEHIDAVGRTYRRERVGTDGVTTLVQEWTWRADDQLESAIDGNGRTTTYAYDQSGRLVRIDYPEPGSSASDGAVAAPDVALGYYQNDALRWMTTDLENLVNPANLAPAKTVRIELDAANRPVSRTFAGTGVSLGFDRLSRIVSWDAGAFDVQVEYDPTWPLRWATATYGDRTASYTYDPLGHVQAVTQDGWTRALGQAGGASLDAAGRLVAQRYTTGTTALTLGDTLDDMGNRQVLAGPAGALTASFDALNRVSSWTQGGVTTSHGHDALGNWTHVDDEHRFVIEADGERVSGLVYDGAGNILDDGNTRYAYDTAGRLVRTVRGTNERRRTVEYDYDPTGQLVGQIARVEEDGAVVGERRARFTIDTTGSYSRIAAVEVRDEADVLVEEVHYDWGPLGLQARTTVAADGTPTVHYPVLDALGSVRQWRAGDGAVVESLDFDAWGRRLGFGECPEPFPDSSPGCPAGSPPRTVILEAEDATVLAGSVKADAIAIGSVDQGDALAWPDIDFGCGAGALRWSARLVSPTAGGSATLRIDGRVAGQLDIEPTAGCSTWSDCDISGFEEQSIVLEVPRPTGVHDVEIHFAGTHGIAYIDSFSLTGSQDVTVAYGDPTTCAGDGNQLTLQAEAAVASTGVAIYSGGVGSTDTGDQLFFEDVDFGCGGGGLAFGSRLATPSSGGLVELWTGVLTGTSEAPEFAGQRVAVLPLSPTCSDWSACAASIQEAASQAPVYGTHDVMIRFVGAWGIGNFDYFTLETRAGGGAASGDTATCELTPHPLVGYVGYAGEWQNPDGTVHLRARTYQPELGRFLQRDPFSGWIDRTMSLNAYLYAEGNGLTNVDPSGLAAQKKFTQNHFVPDTELVPGGFLRNNDARKLCAKYRWYCPLAHAGEAANRANGVLGMVADGLDVVDLVKIAPRIPGMVRRAPAALRGGRALTVGRGSGSFEPTFQPDPCKGNCFTGDTLVQTDQGPMQIAELVALVGQHLELERRIEEIESEIAAASAVLDGERREQLARALDETRKTRAALPRRPKVLSVPDDEPHAEPSYEEITAVFDNGPKPVVAVTIRDEHGNEEVIRATQEHPFWVEGRGWVAAGALKPGDELLPLATEGQAR